MAVLSRETSVLLCLGQGPASGVEIMARLQTVAGAPRLVPGTLYPLLRRLEKSGLVRNWAEDDRSRVGRPRRFHELTAKGVAALERVRREIRQLGSTPPDRVDADGLRRMRSNLLRGFRVSAFARRLQKAGGHG